MNWKYAKPSVLLDQLDLVEADIHKVRPRVHQDARKGNPEPTDTNDAFGDDRAWARVQAYCQTREEEARAHALFERWRVSAIAYTSTCEKAFEDLWSRVSISSLSAQQHRLPYHDLCRPLLSPGSPVGNGELWGLGLVCRLCDQACHDMIWDISLKLMPASAELAGTKELADALDRGIEAFIGIDYYPPFPRFDPEAPKNSPPSKSSAQTPAPGQRTAKKAGANSAFTCARCKAALEHSLYPGRHREGVLRYVLRRDRQTTRTLVQSAESLLRHLKQELQPNPNQNWKQSLARLAQAILTVEIMSTAIFRGAVPPIIPPKALLSVDRLRRLLP